MEIFSGSWFASIVKEQKVQFQELLPELIKKLILNTCSDLNQIRLPGKDDVWAPGFDGIVSNDEKNLFVCEGCTNSLASPYSYSCFPKNTSIKLVKQKTPPSHHGFKLCCDGSSFKKQLMHVVQIVLCNIEWIKD